MKSFLFNVSIIGISLTLVGCNILPDISGASKLSEDIKKLEENQEKQLTQSQMSDFLNEWQNMKPAITNLISLESDLQFVLQQLEQEPQTLKSSLDVQSDIALQEKDDRLDDIEFLAPADITEKFVKSPPEVDELAENVIFADAELLETFTDESDAQRVDTFNETADVDLLSSFEQGTDADLLASFSKSNEITEDASSSEVTQDELQNTELTRSSNSQTEQFDSNKQIRVNSISELTAVFEGLDVASKNSSAAQTQSVQALPKHLIETRQIDKANDIDAKFAQKTRAENIKQMDTKFAQNNSKDDLLLQSKPSGIVSKVENQTDKFTVQAKAETVSMDQKFSVSPNPSLIIGDVTNTKPLNTQTTLDQNTKCKQLSTVIGSGYAVHLASYSKESSAKAGWLDLSAKFEKSLCGLIPILKEVRVNGKQFFSLRAGGFASKAEADSTCAVIEQTNQYCKSTRFDGTLL